MHEIGDGLSTDIRADATLERDFDQGIGPGAASKAHDLERGPSKREHFACIQLPDVQARSQMLSIRMIQNAMRHNQFEAVGNQHPIARMNALTDVQLALLIDQGNERFDGQR